MELFGWSVRSRDPGRTLANNVGYFDIDFRPSTVLSIDYLVPVGPVGLTTSASRSAVSGRQWRQFRSYPQVSSSSEKKEPYLPRILLSLLVSYLQWHSFKRCFSSYIQYIYVSKFCRPVIWFLGDKLILDWGKCNSLCRTVQTTATKRTLSSLSLLVFSPPVCQRALFLGTRVDCSTRGAPLVPCVWVPFQYE